MTEDSSAKAQLSATGRVTVGRYTLALGNPAGTRLESSAQDSTAGRRQAWALRLALARSRGHRRARRTPDQKAQAGIDRASTVTDEVERTIGLCKEITAGRLDAKSVSDEVGALVALLARLDRDERFKEELRLARCVSTLLALAGRWLELARSLREALKAAERLSEPLEEAWALHELGTLHLAAGRHADADRLLSGACEIRRRDGDSRGLAVTERNLQVQCRALRGRLHRRGPRRWPQGGAGQPALFLLPAAALLGAGAAAGAVIAHSHARALKFHAATVSFHFAPSAPHAGQSVSFDATASDAQDPVASYRWSWGDGDPTGSPRQSHAYRRPGTYTILLTVTDADGRVTGRATSTIVIQRPPVAGPNAAFSVQPRSPAVGQKALFDASSSFDPQSRLVGYRWSFSDGAKAEGVEAEHSFARPGVYTVTLTATDALGRHGTQTQIVAVSLGTKRRPAQLSLTCAPSSVALGEAITVTGALSPPRAGETVRLLYTGAFGTRPAGTATTNDAGAYRLPLTLRATGEWSVQGSVAGSSQYLPASSEACPFSVTKPAAGPPSATLTTVKQSEKEQVKEQTRTIETAVAHARAQQGKEEQARKRQEEEQSREREAELSREERPGASTGEGVGEAPR